MLPEYLASSRCIVTEPLKYQLPVLLEEGKNYLSFRTPEECVEACKKILSISQFATQMRYENYRYFLNEVEPSTRIFECLKTALDSSWRHQRLG
jgi:spore maturation protein CgeB